MIRTILDALSPARLITGAIVLGVMAGGVLYYGHQRFNAGEAKVQAKWDREKAATIRDYERRLSEAKESEKGLRDELKDLRDYVSTRPARVVRVCKLPPNPPDPAPERGAGEGTPAPGLVPPAPGPVAGPDIGPDLYADADRCDELSAQVRSLLARQKALEGK